ncbi:MAG: FtsX-like permease family protein [Treponema sp.]|nr:FtsX-like permease family protein [Treponema sp.]
MARKSFGALARIAFRSLARHKVKTILTALAVAVSVMVYILMDGWILGMNLDSRRNIVAYETGAAKLQTKAYMAQLDDKPMYESFADWEPYAEALEEAGYMAAPRFVFAAMLYSSEGMAPVECMAGNAADELRVLRYGNYVENGRMYRGGALEILVGDGTAEKLHLGIPMRPTAGEFSETLALLPEAERAWVRGLYERAGRNEGAFAPKEDESIERFMLKKTASSEERDRLWRLLAEAGRMDARLAVTIDIKAPSEEARRYPPDGIRHLYQMIDAVVVGTVNSPNPKNNFNTVYLPLDVLQDETGLMLEGRVTELLIRAKDADDSALPGKRESAAAITAALEAQLGRPLPPELGIADWQFFSRDYLAVSTGDDVSTRIIVFILFVLSFLGIANTMLLAILERTREIGMMRALGMTGGDLMLCFFIEAGFIGLIGAAAGVLAGCLINIPMVNQGIDYSAMSAEMGGDIGYRVAGAFRSVWHWPVIIGAPIAAALIASAASFFPVRGALKKEVTESLRFE